MSEKQHPTRKGPQAPDHFRILEESAQDDPELRRHSLSDAQSMVRKATQQVMSNPTKLAKVQEWSSQWERAYVEQKIADGEQFFSGNPDGEVASMLIPTMDQTIAEAKARGAKIGDLETRWQQLKRKIEASPKHEARPALKPDLTEYVDPFTEDVSDEEWEAGITRAKKDARKK